MERKGKEGEEDERKREGRWQKRGRGKEMRGRWNEERRRVAEEGRGEETG